MTQREPTTVATRALRRVASGFTEVLAMPGEQVDPSVSFKRATRPGVETGRSVVDPARWTDVAGNVGTAGRDAHSARPAIVHDPVEVDDDAASVDAVGNVDPADAVRTRRAVDEWSDPSTSWTPNVTISGEYRYRLQIAERALELRSTTRLSSVEIVGRLAERFDETEQSVWAILAWMGVVEDLGRKSSVLTRAKPRAGALVHGRASTYANRGCRCPSCREAARLDRIERLGLDPAKVRRYHTRFSPST